MLNKYKTCSVPLGRACQNVNLMVTQFESARTRWFLLPKIMTNAFKRVKFFGRVYTRSNIRWNIWCIRTRLFFERVHTHPGIRCVQTRQMFHFGRVQTRSYSVSNASKTRFKTRLDSKNFHMGYHCNSLQLWTYRSKDAKGYWW